MVYNGIQNKKGMTLVEVIVAMAVLGILSAPISMLFLTSMWTSKASRDQLELNAISMLVKENVVTSVKSASPSLLHQYDPVTGDYSDVRLREESGSGIDTYYDRSDLVVQDLNGRYGSSTHSAIYTFDTHFLYDAGDTTSAGITLSEKQSKTCNISIKKSGNVVRSFNVDINILLDIN